METPSRPASSISSPQVAWTANDLKANPHEAGDKADRVQRMFGAIARRYDLNNRLHSFGLDQRWRKRTVALCQPGPTDDVLDVACGTGDLSEAFAMAGPRSVVGVDFTEAMLDLARHKSNARTWKAGSSTPIFQHGDAMDLEFDDESFDIVSIAFGIRNVADPGRAIGEFRRVLRPGGRLAVLEFSEPRNAILRSLNRFYTHRVMPLTATLIAWDRSGAYRYLPRSVAGFHDQRTFTQLLTECGFVDLRLHPQTFGTCTIYLGRAPGGVESP